MFKSLFDRKKKRSSVTAPADNTVTNDNDREEDGFVLLGETASERSTVYPDRSPIATDYPPSYNACTFNSNVGGWGQAMGQQPSNQKVVKQTGALDSSQNSLSAWNSSVHPGGSPRTVTPSTPNRNQPFTEVIIQDRSPSMPSAERKVGTIWEASQVTLSSHRSPISDVPFKLGELQQLTRESQNNNFASAGRIPNIDVHAYRYDFELERSVLRDFSNSVK